jgi:hypothetical protein
MNAGKSMRDSRSVEHMLVELKQRLREISDLNAAADVLSWRRRPRSSTRDA